MMGGGACPYCQGTERRRRSARTAAGLWVRECCDCGRVVEEMQAQAQDHFYVRAQDTPLCLVTPDLLFPEEMTMMLQPPADDDDDDPFEPTGFITAFSTWSLEPVPVAARSSFSFCGLLAELERSLLLDSPLNNSSSSSSNPTMSTSAATPLHASSSSAFLVDNLRAHLQILEVGSILKLDWEILGHAFQLFRDCSSVTCLRNRNVEALATAALLQAIREAQEPRTLQEISTASNLPQKEIGKYIKILGEALKLSQPINSNSISVHMPRFCKLLQLNQSARDIATHIGEVVVNKCFCTRRNPISISAAAIYLACQLEDKRKTQAEICKVTGLTEVTLRKVYKELLENWDDLLPPNYTPAVPPEKAFPMTCITSCRILTPKVEPVDVFSSPNVQEIRNKHTDVNKPNKEPQLSQMDCLVGQKEDLSTSIGANSAILNVDAEALIHNSELWKPQTSSELPNFRSEKTDWRIDINQTLLDIIELDEGSTDQKDNSTLIEKSCSGPSSSTIGGSWPLSGRPSYDHFLQHQVGPTSIARPPWIGNSNKWELLNPCDNSKERNDIDDIK